MTAPSIALVANGEIIHDQKLHPLLKNHTLIIAVDGGLKHCDRMGLTPGMIVGDLDSVSSELLEKYRQVPILRYPIKKDETDIELAVKEALKLSPDSVTLFGALGNRTDHTLSNLYLASRYPDLMKIQTEWETILFIKGRRFIPSFPGQVVSIFPIGSPTRGITTQGLEWDVQEAVFDQNYMSQSNVCLGGGFDISIKEGTLMCSLLLNS